MFALLFKNDYGHRVSVKFDNQLL